MDFGVVNRAGLSYREAAQIVGVSHVSIYKWINGAKPKEFINGVPVRKRAEAFIALMESLIERGSLPKPHLAVRTRGTPEEVKEKRAEMLAKLRKLLDARVAG